MKNHNRSKQKCSISFGARLLILIMLASVLSSCNTIIQTPVPTDIVNKITPTIENPAVQELTLIPEPQVVTKTYPVSQIIIDLENVLFPPMGDAKENFEKGEYDASVEVIKQWVGIWGGMSLFDDIGDIYDNGLILVPLDGTEKVTCVAMKSDKYAKTLFCPPIDINIGGLKIIPNSGQENEFDKSIIVNLTGTEGLTIKGKSYELTYQITDNYTKNGIRYYDIKTKGFVEGSYIPSSMLIQENEPVEGNLVCVSEEYCMGGKMDVDREVGKIFYEKYMNAILHNSANKDYFNKLLLGDISYQAFQQYLYKNDGFLPSGLKLLRDDGHGYVDMTYITKDPINLSAMRTIVIGPKEWHENYYYIVDYLNKFDKSGMVSPYVNIGKMAYFGWFLDENNYLVLVNGALAFNTDVEWPFILGGIDGNYLPDRDNKIATGHAISFIVYSEKHEGKGWGDMICPFCSESPSSPQENDIYRILGGNLFKVR